MQQFFKKHIAYGFMAGLALLLLVLPVHAVEEIDEFADVWQRNPAWTGDFKGMKERRLVRVLVVHNKMLFFFDKARIRGVTYDMFNEFEKFANEQFKTGTRKIRVVYIPVPRDKLIPWLIEGRGDIAAANLTITDERKELVDFANPVVKNISEILVSGPSAPKVKSVDDLSGKEIHVRKSSSYHEHLDLLNQKLIKKGKKPIKIVHANELMEDADLLEMVNAGMIPMTVVDDHKARFWADVFKDINLHEDITFNTGGQIAWAIRKNSPQTKWMLDEFVKKHKKGTRMGNILYKRYLVHNKWAKKSLSEKELKKLKDLSELFRKYSDKYEFDYLMMVALAYQESQLNHKKRSPVGAVGIMQVLPSTAADKNVNIPDIEDLENNIHAGHKYLRFIRDRYFDDPEIDDLNKMLFSFASYNAGPAKVRRLRNEAKKSGLDPNVWFGNVEVIAAKRIGRETVQYVSNIYKYYLAYRLSRLKTKALESKGEKNELHSLNNGYIRQLQSYDQLS
ncbi:MAG: lytic transglycosylase F [Gammaproteobacteria bacterium]|nr:lytic transglycosylase F [Gammaproteobacteria bacterium]